MSERIHLDHGPVDWPAIVVHGGAGTYERLTPDDTHLARRLSSAIDAAVDAGWAHLCGDGGSPGDGDGDGDGDPLAAVVAAVVSLELDGGFNAGRGSVPTIAGSVEMDAGVMDQTGRAGAVACITGHSAVRAAQAVHAFGGPVLLAGPNADAFAASQQVAELEPLYPPRHSVADPPAFEGPVSPEGTVGAVAVTADGRFAAATSTGGRSGQIPGRVGDTPVPGAGFWCQPGCSVSATGAGEAFLVAGFSRLVGSVHLSGGPLAKALGAGLDAVAGYGGLGGGIAIGHDRTWAAAFNTRAMARGVRHSGGRRTRVLG